MSVNSISCPKCKASYPLSEALSVELEALYAEKTAEEIKRSTETFESRLMEQETIIKNKIRFEVEQASLVEKSDLMNQVKELTVSRDKYLQNELELHSKERALDNAMRNIEQEINKRLKEQESTLASKIRAEIEQTTAIESADMINRINELASQCTKYADRELDLRKKTRELEEGKENLELEFQRKFDEERSRIRHETIEKVTEENRLKALEKDQQMEGLRKQIEELKRKAEQGSQKIQGEVLEIEVERSLKEIFPFDSIENVINGAKGGDIIQHVITNTGKRVGKILYEMKNTKTYSEVWINKLKDDQREESADFAVLVTQALPKGVTGISVNDGIYVVDFSTYLGIAMALRATLIEVDKVRVQSSNMDEKIDALYSYLTGVKFKQRIEAIVSTFQSLHTDLQKEKTAINKIWAVREQKINRILLGTTGMYGDIQGIVGADLQRIESLEFDAIESVFEDLTNE